MNIRLLIIILLISTVSFAQEETTKIDSINDNTNLFIEKYHQQLNINFEVSNERTNYSVPYEDGVAEVKSNLNLRYAFVFGYRFISVRVGIRPPVSDEEKINKGKSKIFRLRVKLLFDRWSHHLLYNRQEGYYLSNSDEFSISSENDDFHIQFPGLTTNVFQGTSVYKFNKNYSLRAIENQTEIQLQSVGTFMPGIDYKYYNLSGADEVKMSEDETIKRETYSEINGFSFAVNAAYHYTFVFHKYWFANAYASPGVGIDLYKSKTYTPENIINDSDNAFFFAFKTGISGGYNGEKIFAGAGYNYVYVSEKFQGNNIQVQPSKDKFHIYVGYRFRAPKQLRAPVDYIEKKVPLLKEDTGEN